MNKKIILFIVLSSWIYALPAGINRIVNKSGIPKNDISIYIKEAGNGGRELASLNASKTRTPASVIKVLPIYAATLKLGFDYRWPTQFYTVGSLKNGVLKGDLVVKGFGDPTLSTRDLKSIVSTIKAKGIKKITGNIVIDRSYFAVGTKNNSGFDKNTYSPYNAMPDAMMFNERISTICITPNKNAVHKKVADGSYKIVNKLQRVNKPCKGRYSWPGLKINNSSAMPEVWLQGKISKKCGKRNICKVITKPYKSFYYALKDTLKKEGVTVSGKMRLNKVPSNANILFTHYSRSLEKIISKTAKKSNNLYARHLLLLLGAKMYGAPSTLAKGRKAVEYILRSKGALGRGTLRIDNGSGLSRTAKLNAKLLAYMYDNAYNRYGLRWMKTLSIAGVDGTIKRRFRGTVVKNRAWMKTGTLNRVKNIGGYVKSRSGRMYTVVILVNTKQGRWKAAQLQNNIMKWLVTYKGRGTKRAVKTVTPSKSKIIIETNTKSVPKKSSIEKPSGAYYIQTGSFSSVPTSDYIASIKKLGLPYTTEYTDKYKVLVGPYSNENLARTSLAKVRKHINGGAFLVNNKSNMKSKGAALY
ncbi:MAG: D-alanyl-D-alanine carboxypeptidase/D-alanyl-D-alanine-endopeptidase [Sulfurovum sp.]|nr:D-alanyl-D-alanine carboxypeptidase/D-alanyl-D-alanine-endopeptidase [Sulfurovum sp.]